MDNKTNLKTWLVITVLLLCLVSSASARWVAYFDGSVSNQWDNLENWQDEIGETLTKLPDYGHPGCNTYILAGQNAVIANGVSAGSRGLKSEAYVTSSVTIQNGGYYHTVGYWYGEWTGSHSTMTVDAGGELESHGMWGQALDIGNGNSGACTAILNVNGFVWSPQNGELGVGGGDVIKVGINGATGIVNIGSTGTLLAGDLELGDANPLSSALLDIAGSGRLELWGNQLALMDMGGALFFYILEGKLTANGDFALPWDFNYWYDSVADKTVITVIGGAPWERPVADAGPDQTVTDSDVIGSEQVTLNGSGSYDPDGTIVSWIWTDDLGDIIPDGEVVSATLSVGAHTITLEVTDDMGATDIDTVVITVPMLSVLTPNGEEFLKAGDTYPITWSSIISISNVLIEYSIDNGGDWTPVTTVANTGSYSWFVPMVGSVQCLVRISDSSNPSINDTSDAMFKIRKSSRGSGTAEDPYLIYTATQMDEIGQHSEDWSSHFILMADIDLAAYTGTAFNIIGTYTSPDWTRFTGSFDGGGHIIRNFTYTISSNGGRYFGLFGNVSGEIKDLGMTNVNVHTWRGDHVGGLVGGLLGSISNCFVDGGGVSGDDAIGGLVGSNEGTVSNCYATSSASGNTYVGGLVGLNWYGTITNCYATGSVSGIGWQNVLGGLVGGNRGTVSNSFWDTETSGQSTSAGGTGKTTAEIQTKSTFTDAGWNFDSVWDIIESQTYPFLRVFGWIYLPDLQITSEDITFGAYPAVPGEPNSISATVWNVGTVAAENVEVVFKDFDTVIGSQVISNIPPGDSSTVSIEHTWPESSFRLITVTVDPSNNIIELDENNNSGSKVYQVGDVPQMDARIAISCSAPTGFPKGSVATINAEAIYDILVEGQPNYEYPVKGGSVSVEVFNPNGEPNDLLESFTDTEGRFSFSFDVPGQVGDRFKVVITVTDGTLTETLERWFDVIAFKDLWVRPSDITFSDSNPDVGETITIGATIHADGRNTYTEYDIPVTFYVYPPTGGSYQIGQTKIITQMAPGDSNTVSTTWSAQECGEYYIQVALEPEFSDDRNFNNRATRRLPVCTTDPPTQPPTEPVEFDLWVYANDVNFSNENPDLGETITIEALVHAKSDNMRTEPNVPVTFYAYHATGESYKIGRTLTIEEINPGDNQLVSTTWRNAAEGEYVIEIMLGPDFSDDNNGNNQATRELSVGNRPPVAVCQDVMVEVDSSCQGLATLEDVDGGSFDPDGDLITLSLEPAGPYPLGQTTVTLTVSDGIESATCEATITVIDTTPPVITGVPADETVECDSVPPPAEPTATDNCDPDVPVIFDETRTDGDCPNRYTLTRTWTATDDCGNSTTETQIISVQDTTPPVFTAMPLDTNVQRDGNGNMAELDAWLASIVEAADGCGAVNVTKDFTSFPYECGKTGSVTVTWTATDECGNSATTSATFAINDPTAGVTYDGDLLLSTAGAATVDTKLVATLRDDVGNLLDIDGEEVTFTLTAEGVERIVETTASVDGVANVVIPLEPAIYMIKVTLGCSDFTTSAILVIYNPQGGFASGGGWLMPADDGLNTHSNVKAHFGFNVEYKGSLEDPNGSLEFRYQDDYVNLESTLIDRLVVTGGKIAQFKGWAVVNGVPGNWFFVKAIDNGSPGKNNDIFEIKIWFPGVDPEGDPSDLAGGVINAGNIVVHAKD